MNPADNTGVFTEQADYEKGFGAYFAQKIAPLLGTLEADRLKFKQDFIVSAIFSGAAAALALAALWLIVPPGSMGSKDAEGRIKLSFFILFAATVLPTYFYHRYGEEAKGTLLPPMMSFFGGISFHPHMGINELTLRPFQIMPMHEIYHSEDYTNGTLDNLSLELGLIKLENRSKNSTYTVFRGIAVKFEVKKPFEGMTVLRHNQGMFGHALSSLFGNHGMERVQLEDPRFNASFEVSSTNQVEARYLLTTAFMERMMLLGALMHHWGDDPSTFNEQMALAAAFSNPCNVLASFYGRSLLLLIPYAGKFFEPGSLFTSATHLNEMRCVLYQIHLFRRIIEVLKLDQNIGM